MPRDRLSLLMTRYALTQQECGAQGVYASHASVAGASTYLRCFRLELKRPSGVRIAQSFNLDTTTKNLAAKPGGWVSHFVTLDGEVGKRPKFVLWRHYALDKCASHCLCLLRRGVAQVTP